MHGPIASPYAGKQHSKVVYLSTKTPFMSALKRVKQLLRKVEQRDTQAELHQARRNRRRPTQVPMTKQTNDESEPVYVKATGKAIDKALQLALHLQMQQDLRVKVKTGSVDAIDDLVVKEDDVLLPAESLNEARSSGMDLDQPDGDANGKSMLTHNAEDISDLPEARVKHASVLILEVSLR